MRTKRTFKVKACFIIFKGLSVAKNRLRPESAPLIADGVRWFRGGSIFFLKFLIKKKMTLWNIGNLALKLGEGVLNYMRDEKKYFFTLIVILTSFVFLIIWSIFHNAPRVYFWCVYMMLLELLREHFCWQNLFSFCCVSNFVLMIFPSEMYYF